MPFIDKSILTADTQKYTSSKHETALSGALKRISESDLSGNSLLKDINCPLGTDTGKVMTGTLDGTAVLNLINLNKELIQQLLVMNYMMEDGMHNMELPLKIL